MRFPILTSLIVLPIAGALVLLLVRHDEDGARSRLIALTVSVLVFAETLLLWARFDPRSADFQFVERYAWIPSFRDQLRRRRGRHQPSAAGADGLLDPARAVELVGVGAPPSACVLHLFAAARKRDDGRLRRAGSVPVLRVLGRDAHPHVFPDRHLGIRAPCLRRGEVHPVYDGGQRPDAGGHPRPGVTGQDGDRQLTRSIC